MKDPNMKSQGNLFSDSRADTDGQTDGQTHRSEGDGWIDMTMVLRSFRDYTSVRKKWKENGGRQICVNLLRKR
jgi:hypothetical protein